MQVVITGCGRSGTNLLLEMVRASGVYTFTRTVEDRQFFKHEELPKDYGSKIAIEWDAMTIESMMEVMKVNTALKVLFSFRHPYDTILSKIYRGRPKSQGGDNDTEQWAKDASIEVAARYIGKSWDIYQALATKYPNRVKPVRMEDILMNTFRTVRYVARFLAVSVNEKMGQPWMYNRNAYQNRRYRYAMDSREVNKWKDLENNYGGWFKYLVPQFAGTDILIKEQADYFRYELI